MPHIIVRSDPREGPDTIVTLEETVLPDNLASPHYSEQLVERLAWAVSDADRAERDRGAASSSRFASEDAGAAVRA